MKKHYKVLKIEKNNDYLEIWVKKKGKYIDNASMFDSQFSDEYISYIGTSLDASGKYIILTFALRSIDDIDKYLYTPTDEYKKFAKKFYKKYKNIKEMCK